MDAIAFDGEGTTRAAEQPGLPESVQNRIGEQLRALYNQIVEEPVPDHLHKLLKRLKNRE